MAKAPTVVNGIDIDSDAPPGGDVALVGDASGDGHIIIDGEEDDDDNWDQPGGPKKPVARKQGGETEADGEFDEEDSRLAYSDTDELPNAETENQRRGRRAQRNARRREQRTAAEAQIGALQATLEEQGKIIRSLVTGQSSLAVNTVAGQISQLEGAIRIADEEMATAIKNADGDTFAKAQGIRDGIVGRLAGLRAQKERMDALAADQGDAGNQQQQQRQPARPQVDPRVVQVVESYFDRFCDRFPWFDPESSDPDSNIVRAVDAHLVAQGHQRHTPVFWQEMERTLANRYNLKPSRENEQVQEQDDLLPPRRQEQRGPAMNRGGQRPPTTGGRGGTNGRSGFHLNETQTSMLRDEGLIGDNLSKEDIAKRDRIINKWRAGTDSLRRQGAGR